MWLIKLLLWWWVRLRTRSLVVGGRKRTYHVHVPPQYRMEKPAPVVLALHGPTMTGPLMAWFSGLNQKADQAGFLAVYPNGTGPRLSYTWNGGNCCGSYARVYPGADFLFEPGDQQQVVVGPHRQKDDHRHRQHHPVHLHAEKVLPDQHGQPEGRAQRKRYRAHDHQGGNKTSRDDQHDDENKAERSDSRDQQIVFGAVHQSLKMAAVPAR